MRAEGWLGFSLSAEEPVSHSALLVVGSVTALR